MDSAAVGLAGFFTIEVKDSRSGEVRHNISFPNLITNQGMDAFGGSTQDFVNTCFLGSSATAPSAMDTGMGALLGVGQSRTGIAVGNTFTAPYYGYNRFNFTFPTGAIVGTVREVGVGTATSLFSRALITNNGVPTSINVTGFDTVIVNYEFRIYPRTLDTSATIDITGSLHTFTFRSGLATTSNWHNGLLTRGLTYASAGVATNVILYSGSINPDITANNTSSVVAANPIVSWSPYVAGSFSRRLTVVYTTSEGNDVPSGIGAMSIFMPNGKGCFQVGISPRIQKNASNTLTLVFGYSWARYE